MERYSADKKLVVMTRDEVRGFGAWAINELGVPHRSGWRSSGKEMFLNG
jgi:hypothetical protein